MTQPGLEISKYKCFGETFTGFQQTCRINLIVGKNNTGKSALLDAIEIATNLQKPSKNVFDGQENELALRLTAKLTQFDKPTPQETAIATGYYRPHINTEILRLNSIRICKPIFPKQVSETSIDTDDEEYLNTQITNHTPCPRTYDLISLNSILYNCGYKVDKIAEHPFENKIFRQIFAERDITPEVCEGKLKLDGSGSGVTKAIQAFINRRSLDRILVEGELLEHLNQVCSPDSHFSAIYCEKNDHDERWEILLKEEHKGAIALSSTGSGLKTIILVLCHTLLVPELEKKPLSEFIFAFEELENNLHPAILRRLIAYLVNAAREHDFILFLTSHSNVMIDAVNQLEDGQIIHVTHDGKNATTAVAHTHIQTRGILDDLDVRASDLLQANGIIWVEGPSDRIYFKRWVELFSDGELMEGLHYQVVFYGGRLLSHLSANPDDEESSGIQLFNVNRNNLVLMDSDKRAMDETLNSTKQRIIQEMEDNGHLTWVTQGREVENYIPLEAFNALLSNPIQQTCDTYDSVFDWLDTTEPGKGSHFVGKKPLLAEKVAPHLTLEALTTTLDIKAKMTTVIETIRQWNGMQTTMSDQKT